ncbi:MAG: dihydropteroate synthase [bacterium]|nr:dihydropteroate synthase [bacterium]
MLSLPDLAALAELHRGELAVEVAPLRIGDRVIDTNTASSIMGCVNLSRDSTYRESIAISTDAAVRMARVMAAQGADLVDVGAESSTARAARVSADDQIASLSPVIERLSDEGIAVSVETYDINVVRACLKAGAQVLNLTGIAHQDAILDLAAEHDATVVLCYVAGANVRDITDVATGPDPIPPLLEHFGARVGLARERGVDRIVIDPGMGFYYGNLVEPVVRARHQATVLLQSFRLKVLGQPICNALPHAFDLFGDQFRTAEGFFAVLAAMGGTSVFRTHEVAHVRSVLDAMQSLNGQD